MRPTISASSREEARKPWSTVRTNSSGPERSAARHHAAKCIKARLSGPPETASATRGKALSGVSSSVASVIEIGSVVMCQQRVFFCSALASSRTVSGAFGNLVLSSPKVEQAASFWPSAASDMPSLRRVSGALSPDLYFL